MRPSDSIASPASAQLLLPRLAAGQWTDFNATDPGVTLLGEMSDALADVAYRTEHDIPDLLASYTGGPALPPSLPSAATVLTCQPVTLTDLRRLAMDCAGVRDAWATPVDNDPPLFFREGVKCVSTDGNMGRPLSLAGLLRMDWLPDTASRAVSGSNNAASGLLAALHAARPLGADFTAIVNLTPMALGLSGGIEISPVENTTALADAVFAAVSQCLCPRLPLATLQQEEAAGHTVDEILQGPAMQRGFPGVEALARAPFPREVALSALMAAITAVPGVKAVTQLAFVCVQSLPNPWFLDVPQGYFPQLDPSCCSGLVFTCGEVIVPCVGKLPVSPSHADQPLPLGQRDIVVPQGIDREVTSYVPLQEYLPAVYATGQGGLSLSASVQRQALAHQLQAFLTVFDQVLADDLAQLGHFASLMAFSADPLDTYAVQVLPQATDFAWQDDATVVNINDADSLHNVIESPGTAAQRRNRFLNHLMARFGESLGGATLLAGSSGTTDLAQSKAAFLRDLARVGGARGTGFDRTKAAWQNAENVGGYKLRLCRLLGIKDPSERPLGGVEATEGFHLVEHILLRPRGSEVDGTFFSLAESVSAFADGGDGKVSCTSPAHGLSSGATIRIFGTGVYDGGRQVTVVDADTFTIPGTFAASAPFTGWWEYPGQPRDPFSHQVSLVFPKDVGSFGDAAFQKFVEQTVATQTPAHLTAYVLWLEAGAMSSFETVFQPWLQAFEGNGAPTWPQSCAVAEQLGMGHALLLPSVLDAASVSFDGASSWIQIPGYNGIAGDSARTVEFWMKTTGKGSYYTELIGWGGNQAESPPASSVWAVRLTNGGLIAVYGAQATGTTLVNDNQWHHVAAVLPADSDVSGADVLIYVDGRLEAKSSAGTGSINTAASGNVLLGSDPYGPPVESANHLFVGQLTDVRVWSTARSAKQICAYMHERLSGMEPGLEAYWKLDVQPTAASPLVPDSSVNKRDGFLTPRQLPGWLDSLSVAFDGSHYLQAAGYAGITGSAARTVEFWMKSTININFHQICGWGSTGGTSQGTTFAIRINGNKPGGLVMVSLYDSNDYEAQALTPVCDGQWHHVAVVVPDCESPSAQQIVFYCDGTPAVSDTSTVRNPSTVINTDASGTVKVGTCDVNNNAGGYFSGSLAEVRIWSLARTAAQIQQSMNTQLLGNETGLAAYWALTGPPVGTNPLPDGSGNAHVLTAPTNWPAA